MKLGIFGDSFASTLPNIIDESWPVLLYQYAGCTHDQPYRYLYARGGTSHWYSFTKFMENYQKYDHIVFVHSNTFRWPAMPPGLEGEAWNIGFVDNKKMKAYNNVRKDIFPQELLSFLWVSVFKEVNRICEENDIYLINIIAFGDDPDFEIPDTKFPVLSDLNSVSKKEIVTINGRCITVFDIIGELGYEIRNAHLNKPNNEILAKTIYQYLKDKTLNKKVDLTVLPWVFDDSELNEKYKKEIVSK